MWVGGNCTQLYTVTITMITHIKMGSNESRFNLSLTVRGKVTRQCPQATTSEEKAEPNRRIKPTPTAYQPNALLLHQISSNARSERGCREPICLQENTPSFCLHTCRRHHDARGGQLRGECGEVAMGTLLPLHQDVSDLLQVQAAGVAVTRAVQHRQLPPQH